MEFDSPDAEARGALWAGLLIHVSANVKARAESEEKGLDDAFVVGGAFPQPVMDAFERSMELCEAGREAEAIGEDDECLANGVRFFEAMPPTLKKVLLADLMGWCQD